MEETVFACTNPKGEKETIFYYYQVKYSKQRFISAIEIKSLNYQARKDILSVELIGGIKAFLELFPREFKELRPNYLLEPKKDCKWEPNKSKGLSCKKEENGKFIDIFLQKNNSLQIPEFIIS